MGSAEATYAQHAVWFTEQAGVAGTAYHMALGIRFGADLDRRALVGACEAVITRHDILGVRVVTGPDGVPRLAPTDERPVVTVDTLTDERIDAELARPYDLHTGPLARFTLLSGVDEHMLLVTAHHLVFDGTSKDILVRDLAAAYDALRGTGPAGDGTGQAGGGVLAEMSGGYAGHAAAEQERVAAELPAAREYWARHWSGPGGIVLPGLTRVPTGAEPGATVALDLAGDRPDLPGRPDLPSLSDRLDRAAADLGVTRFELFLAVVHVLLQRYGNRRAPVGVTLATRTADTTDHIGLFVNELPVGVEPATGTFAEHAQAVRAQLRQTYRFRAVPLSQAVTGLRPAPALTAVSVGYRRRAPEPGFTGVTSSVDWTMFSGSARNALHIQIVDGPTGPTVGLQHAPAVIPTEAVARIGAHLRTLLHAVLEDPRRPVADLPVLPAEERELVLHRFNETGRQWPRTGLLALLAEQVRQRPDATAVADGDRTLSYAQLDATVTHLAGALRDRGVKPGSLVAVVLDRSWQAVVTLLAVLRCRAAYVPVDPTHPAARQALILADARPALVVTTAGPAGALAADHAVLDLDQLDLDRPDPVGGRDDPAGSAGSPGPDEPAGEPVTGQPEVAGAADDPDPDDLAYVLYTSGSTGQPKGVAVSHGALTNLLLGLRELFDSGPEHRWLHLTSLSFDISGVEIYLPLVTGGQVVVASGLSALDGAGVCRLIDAAGVTHAQATPAGWRVLLAAGLAGPLVALTGGEALPVGLARQLRARTTRLVNGYGPTEATIYATVAEIPAEPTGVSIGRPLPNVRAYLLDADRRPVPVGVPGDLYLGGTGLAAGYLGRPELTAQRFIVDPGFPEQRLYHTGDRCRWLPDGQLEFLGRTDDQVKIRGYRVELGEITARLLEHPALAEAAVVLRTAGGDQAEVAGGDPLADSEDRLVAYLVPRGAAPTPTELRQHLQRTLPAAMVPTDWVVLPALPLSPNGKLDRAALPAPSVGSGAAGTVAGAPPADPVIEELTVIWQDVLRIPDIGIHEDLFDLGGHSLTITRIAGRIQQRLGVEVPVDVFFDMPTIAEIADVVRQSGGGR